MPTITYHNHIICISFKFNYPGTRKGKWKLIQLGCAEKRIQQSFLIKALTFLSSNFLTTLINQLKSNSNEYNLSDIHKINNDMILDGMPSFDCYFPDFILGFILFIIYWAIVWYLFISPSFQSPC